MINYLMTWCDKLLNLFIHCSQVDFLFGNMRCFYASVKSMFFKENFSNSWLIFFYLEKLHDEPVIR